jgi:hypothetical protein
MLLPGVSLRVKLVGIGVLVILTASLVGTAVAAVGQVLAEGNSQARFDRGEAAPQGGSQGRASDEPAVMRGLKFVCPFH